MKQQFIKSKSNNENKLVFSSLRGAKRRSNPENPRLLRRFAPRNDVEITLNPINTTCRKKLSSKGEGIYKVGITGGIGSGKSTAAKCFAELGVHVIEADEVIKQLTSNNNVIFQKIINYFGSKILDKYGKLDRKYLRKTIFKNSKKKKWLEELLHPLAYQELERQANTDKFPYCILVIPLLVESPPPHKLLDRILVIDTPKKLQIERATKRDQSNVDLIKAIIASQATNKQRLAIADDIIKNNKSIKKLKMQIKLLHNKYLEMSKSN